MDELNFTGNCLKGSRPILSFDAAFDTEPHLQLIKSLFTQIFGVPPGARKSKPFIDRVMGFSFADGTSTPYLPPARRRQSGRQH
jgi:ribosome biogenesis protein BRX1